ncbi:MAG TPA: hypothetical protein DCX54_07925 [Flavobacteriales bacterium]|nr:hypothetical protein [Flavobacteriales bacterium]
MEIYFLTDKNMVLQIFYPAASIIFSLFLARVCVKNINAEGSKSALFLSLSALIIFISNLIYSIFPSDLMQSVKLASIVLGITLASTAIFTFSLDYTLRSYWINTLFIFFLAVIPLLTQVVFWLFLTKQDVVSFLVEFNTIYSYSLLVGSIIVLGQINSLFSFKARDIYFWLLLSGPIFAAAVLGLDLMYIKHQWSGALFAVAILFSMVGISTNIFLQAPKAVQLRRDSMLENVSDSWITLDADKKIVDCNQTALALFNATHDDVLERPLPVVLSEFLNLNVKMDDLVDDEIEKSVRINEDTRYFNIRLSPIENWNNTPIGMLVTLRDVSSRKREEIERQRARDEMFVLLNAISNAASQSVDLEEFLSDVIYQIVSPFKTSSIFIYAVEEQGRADSNHRRESEYYLAAHIGLSTDAVKQLQDLPGSTTIFQLLDGKKYLLLEDFRDSQIPNSIQLLNLSSMLIIPLVVQGEGDQKLVGVLFLGRRENPSFPQDDIIRLNILAEQIASLIDSDRRKKLAITLSERKKLMRDVHDSVSQKLYGLVTLTEAAQAGLEAGAALDFEKVLSRIGENARQAVKELRLFLFQMQPSNLDKEGLISVLHHRLAAVEGRADIKVRFLADDPIQISRKKEIALYYIAQESLNNVLRHAHAKAVSVILKQGHKFITLEVSDDGCGFEPGKIKQGGLGLENIKERVKQENGKLKISSMPGKGTIIKVTFEQNKT